MNNQSISTGMTPELIIGQVMGDLVIKGWDEPRVDVHADPDQLALEADENTIHISCQDDCEIRVPRTATLQVGSVHGDAHFKYLADDLDIADVHGSLTMRTVGPTQIGTVHGDFSAKEVNGSLSADAVFGNAAVREILGNCILHEVQGNLDLRDIAGILEATSSGNVRLRMDMPITGAFQVHADGNLHCTFTQEVSAAFELTSDAETIKVKLPDAAHVHRERHISLSLGGAEQKISLSASGGLYLFCDNQATTGDIGSWSEDFSQQIAQQVEAQISSQMGMISQQISAQMERVSSQLNRAGMDAEHVSKILEQARLVSERETARTQEKVRRAQEKLERKLETARRQSEARAQAAETRTQARSKRGWGLEHPNMPPAPPTPPVPPAPPQPAEQASEEERLMILRMLEQKKISLDEADRLLSALEGKE